MRGLALLLLPLLLAAPAPAVDPPATGEGSLRLILHDPTGRDKPMESCDVALCSSLRDLLEGASTSIDFAVYGMRGQPVIYEALVAAQKRGVKVRGVVDNTLDGKNYYGDTARLMADLGTVRTDLATDKRTASSKEAYDPGTSMCWRDAPLTDAGEPFKGPKQCVGYELGETCILSVHASREDLTFEGDIMHNKFFVVDGEAVWMGSTNVSDSGTGGYNANLVSVVKSKEVAAWYTAEFLQMWEHERYHGEKQQNGSMKTRLADGSIVEGWFSPVDRPITRAVVPAIAAARERIDVGIFFLTHKVLVKELIRAHQRGVKVRIVLDATAAKNGYTKHELVRAAGIPLKIENWGGKMHMKAAAIDGKVVIAGSMNWTSAGEWGNDENTLIIRSAKHAMQFHAYYDKMWKNIPDKWLKGRPDPESKDSTTACSDGSDNDFDHLRDADDPGCSAEPPPLPNLPAFTIVPKADGHGLIKGNVNSSGRKTYHVPTGQYYDDLDINTAEGDAFFCSELDAREQGFKRSSR